MSLGTDANRRYLWVALQIESIFPSRPTTIVTHEQVFNLINNLPKDLPETYERALEQVTDSRYGESIMRIVAAAPSPLTLDEVKVALTVVPGEPVWYAAKVPTNSAHFVALCGGNLLELDEEDQKVRFIHYSVVSHLLQPTENPGTMLYHFTMQDAEILAGAICITFLNMSIFETGVTTTKQIHGSKLSERVKHAASYEQPLVARLAHHFRKWDHHQPTSPEVDIGRLLLEVQVMNLPKFDPKCFQGYAASNWLRHSRLFQRQIPVCEAVWHLWMRLLCGDVARAKPGFQSLAEDSSSALSWAIEHHHEGLIRTIFNDPSTEPGDLEEFSKVVFANIQKNNCCESSTWPHCLGIVLVHLFKLTADTMLLALDNAMGLRLPAPCAVAFHAFDRLLAFGANPSIPHTRNGKHVLEMLLEILGYVRVDWVLGSPLDDFTKEVLTLSDMSPLLQDDWVPYALRKIIEIGNTRAFLMVLSHRPNMKLLDKSAEEVSLLSVAVAQNNYEVARTLLGVLAGGGGNLVPDEAAIQHAFQNENSDMVKLLANHYGLEFRRLGPAIICFKASRPEPRYGRVIPSSAFLQACMILGGGLSEHQIFEHFKVQRSHNESRNAERRELVDILLELAEATPPEHLNSQCPQGNTALHYLTGGIENFSLEAIEVASRLLGTEETRSCPTVKNKDGQSPLRRAIDRASQNCWGPSYLSSISFLTEKVCPAVVSNDELIGGENSILGFAIRKGAGVDPVICSIVHAGADMNAVHNGATPLEIAVHMPSSDYATQVTYFLLAHGADPRIQFSTGDSLLHNMGSIKWNWLLHNIFVFKQTPCQDRNNCNLRPRNVHEAQIWEWLISPD